MRNLFGTLALAAILSGCGSTGIPSDGNIQSQDPAEGGISEVPNPTPAMAKKSGTSLEKLQHGHVTYMLKCGECHAYKIPKDLDVDEWEDAMPKMIRHAGLAPDDEKAVLAYVIAVKGQ